MKKIKYGAKRVWENELMRWRGYIEVNGKITVCEYIRTTKKAALQDAKILKEGKNENV
jgi:hypothetical protein